MIQLLEGLNGYVALEVSRLTRSSADWHRLLELCGLADVVIIDEQAVFAPRDYNDRLLLGLKGQMSEAEQLRTGQSSAWRSRSVHAGDAQVARARLSDADKVESSFGTATLVERVWMQHFAALPHTAFA